MYDTEAGNFSGLTTKLAHIILKRDEDECFFSYGYNKEKTALLYLFCKEMIPNAVTATCFTKHLSEILNERRNNEEFSNLFYYLPSTTGRNEDINQFRGNVNLIPIDCSLEFLSSFSKDGVKFQPELLSSEVLEIRNLQVEIMYNFLIIWLKRAIKIYVILIICSQLTTSIQLICLGLVQQRKDLFQQYLN